MKLEELLNICQFKSFPFDVKPNISPDVWAGRQDILDELNYFRNNVIGNHLAEFGIVCGDYGSGKSQTLLHVRYMIEEEAREQGYDVLCVYIPNPCGLGGRQNYVENYQYIVSQGIGQANIAKICKAAKDAIQASVSETMSKEELQDMLRDTSAQERKYKKKFGELMTDPPIPYELLDSLIARNTQAWEWISGQKAHNNVGNVSVQPLTSHVVCARALAQLIILATKCPTTSKDAAYKAVILLVDQAENIAQLAARTYQEHIAGWRTIIDEIGGMLGLLWAMDGKAEDVIGNFTDAIQRRQTIDPRKLSLDLLYEDEPKEFFQQIIGIFRIEGANMPTDVYPFNEAALQEIVSLTAVTTPSNLLNNARRVFTRAAADDVVIELGDVINADYVTSVI